MIDPNPQVAKFHLNNLERDAKPFMKNPDQRSKSWGTPFLALAIASTAISLVFGVFPIA